jgi:hypothetical protein
VESPTTRSLKRLRTLGYLCAVVEHWNSHAGIRQDLFGFADILAVHAGKQETLMVQTTTGSNMAARIRKLQASPKAVTCLEAGVRLQVHGWTKRKRKPTPPRRPVTVGAALRSSGHYECRVCRVATLHLSGPGREITALEKDTLC